MHAFLDRLRRMAVRMNRQPLVAAFLLVASCLLGWRLLAFTDRYAVGLLYWDQWDLYTPLFRSSGWWDAFRWQHGPHRQGLGMVVVRLLAEATRWNTRADAFAVAAALCLALVAAILLKHRIFKTLAYSDVILACLYLSLSHYEALVVVPNPSHGALPTLLVLGYCLALFVASALWRYGLVLLLNFLMVYTGFGIFIAPITMGLLGLDAYHHRADLRSLALVTGISAAVLLSDASFLIGYRFDPAIPNWSFSRADLPEYLVFAGLMLAVLPGAHIASLGYGIPAALGVCLLALLIGLLAFHGVRLWRDPLCRRPLSLVSAVLISFTLLFCFGTALGRMPLGLQASQAPRYLPLLLPAYFALYLNLVALPWPRARGVLLALYLAVAAVGALPSETADRLALPYLTGRTEWRRCYRNREDVARCNRETDFLVYPDPTRLPRRLAYLKKHRLNLFASE